MLSATNIKDEANCTPDFIHACTQWPTAVSWSFWPRAGPRAARAAALAARARQRVLQPTLPAPPARIFSTSQAVACVQSNLLGDFEHLRALFHGLNLQKDEARGRTHRERGGTCEYLRARGVHLGTNRMQLLNVSRRSSKLQQHNQCVTRLHILAIDLTVSDTCCMPRKSAMFERVCGAR